jgi:hypothetical protein
LLSRNIIPLLLALASLVAAPARGFAEELRQVFQQDLSDSSDNTLTPQQWRQRVEDARRQSEAFVAQARSHAINSIQSDQENVELTDQLAMNDPSLKPGDIVSTSHGLLVFIGRDGAERRLNDFERIPQVQVERSRGMVR